MLLGAIEARDVFSGWRLAMLIIIKSPSGARRKNPSPNIWTSDLEKFDCDSPHLIETPYAGGRVQIMDGFYGGRY